MSRVVRTGRSSAAISSPAALQPLTGPSFLPCRIPSGASRSGSHIGGSHTNVGTSECRESFLFPFAFLFSSREVNFGVEASPWLTLHRICGVHRSLTYSSTPQEVSSDVRAKRYLHRVEEGSEFETMTSSKPRERSLYEPGPLLPMSIYPIIVSPSPWSWYSTLVHTRDRVRGTRALPPFGYQRRAKRTALSSV